MHTIKVYFCNLVVIVQVLQLHIGGTCEFVKSIPLFVKSLSDYF